MNRYLCDSHVLESHAQANGVLRSTSSPLSGRGQMHASSHAAPDQATHAALGTPVVLVLVLKLVKTYVALWCVGATAGSRMINTKVPTRCQAAEKALNLAMKLVGRKLMHACITRTTAAAAA